MTQKAEDYYPPFRDGFTTNEPSTFNADMTVNGDVMVNGNVLADNIGGGPEIISNAGATRALLAGESGSVCLCNKADGIIWTLPPPTPGMSFSFIVTTTITSNAYKIITDSSSTFLLGLFIVRGSSSPDQDAGGATNRAISWTPVSANFGHGGIINTTANFLAINTTQWYVTGYQYTGPNGSNSITSFATS